MDSHHNPLDTPPHDAYWQAIEDVHAAIAGVDSRSRAILRKNKAFERFAATLGGRAAEVWEGLFDAISLVERDSTTPIEGWTRLGSGPAELSRATCSPIDAAARLWLVRLSSLVSERTLDEVTGVADRRCLREDLDRRCAGGSPFAVLFVDLNGFKQVNDLLGHMVGDRALREVAQHIEGCLRDGDLVGRFGGDEFVVLLDGLTTEEDLTPVIARIQSAVAQPLLGIPAAPGLSASVGWSFCKHGARCPADLLNEADSRMYANKHAQA